MAASSRLSATLLGLAAVILAAVAWKPWHLPRLSAPSELVDEGALGATLGAQGADVPTVSG